MSPSVSGRCLLLRKLLVAVNFIGAAYLIWLGIQKWWALSSPLNAEQMPERRTGLFFRGLLVNLTNPKAIIFIGPRATVHRSGAAASASYLLIAATLCLTDIVVMSAYALTMRRLGGWFHDPSALRLQNRLFSGLFIAAGTLLAFSSRS